MPFDLKKLDRDFKLQAGVNGAFHERAYRLRKPKWYSLLCQHGAYRTFAEDKFPSHPAVGNNVLKIESQENSDEELWLVSSKCLVCSKVLLEGRIKKADGTPTSCGALYALTKDTFLPAPKDISEEALLEFYNREWEFRTDLLADFNKLTIAIAVAASVFFDKYPSVFYTFIVSCFILIALYAAAYLAQQQITRRYYRDAGRTLAPAYKTSFDDAAKYLQFIFGVAIVAVLCVMIRAERMSMTKPDQDDLTQKTRAYNPPTKTQDTRPYIPPVVVPEKPAQPPQPAPDSPKQK